MPAGRLMTLFWALGLSVSTGFIVSAVVRIPPAMSPMAFTGGLTAISGIVLMILLWTQREQWEELGPHVGFVVFFLSLFVGVVVLGRVTGAIVGHAGLLTTGAQLIASAVAFSVTAWLCFGGGAKDCVQVLGPRLGLEI